MSDRVIFGMLTIGADKPVAFELRHGSWLCDDPSGLMIWHGGPFAVEGGATTLKAATDMDVAIRLDALDPATAVKDARGSGALLETAKATGPIDLTWSVTSVIDLPG
ncbi:MAG: hypothetical protein JWQ11_1900 [Rhizobacter sp.]|nr:hypothetical protein [Rhizobacter sp.]